NDFLTVLAWSLEQKPISGQNEDIPFPPAQEPGYWLIWLAGLAVMVELLLPLLAVSNGPAWVLRTVVALLAGRLLTPNPPSSEHSTRIDYPWLPWALGLVILFEWALLTFLARRWRDGVIPTALAICCGMTAIVLVAAAHQSACEYALLAG